MLSCQRKRVAVPKRHRFGLEIGTSEDPLIFQVHFGTRGFSRIPVFEEISAVLWNRVRVMGQLREIVTWMALGQVITTPTICQKAIQDTITLACHRIP